MQLHLSIRHKLAILAWIPVLGALILAIRVVSSAREEAKKAESLGSVERLVDLSAKMTGVLHALQAERADVGLAAAGEAEPSSTDAARITDVVRRTDAARDELERFLAPRDVTKLPRRLAVALETARAQLTNLPTIRAKALGNERDFHTTLEAYAVATRALVQATAALSDLSDDGEFLRLVTSLTAWLELEDRASEEHSLLAYVFTHGDFPPGIYRRLVTLVSEQDTHAGVFQTVASMEDRRLYSETISDRRNLEALAMRKDALEATNDSLPNEPEKWFEVQASKLQLFGTIETELGARMRGTILSKLASTRRLVNQSLGTAAAVVVPSLVLAFFLARMITQHIETLRTAARLIAQGDLTVRVHLNTGDELGQLGGAFNDMAAELERARSAQRDQARMARELEIAAAIQRGMLPPSPTHAEFEFAGRMRPADEVGGDFYDVLSDPESGRLWVTFGDVSGHGVSAGLVMLMTQVAFASHFLEASRLSPENVLRNVNALLRENITRLNDDKYVTAQLLTYSGRGRFQIVGASVWPIVFRRRTGKCETIATPGPWLGIMPALDDVPTTIIDLEVGDVLCLYSDGITEARDAAGQLFDTARLREVIERAIPARSSLDDVTSDVFGTVEAYSGQHEDDWTMLLVRRVGPN